MCNFHCQSVGLGTFVSVWGETNFFLSYTVNLIKFKFDGYVPNHETCTFSIDDVIGQRSEVQVQIYPQNWILDNMAIYLSVRWKRSSNYIIYEQNDEENFCYRPLREVEVKGQIDLKSAQSCATNSSVQTLSPV